jgi:thiamine biosynthesis lipoprotein
MTTRSYKLRPDAIESRQTFECFGGSCTVIVADAHRPADAAEAVGSAKRALLDWHRRFSRFEHDSELSRFNHDPRERVSVSPMLRRLLEVALAAARDTGGLVDSTLGAEIERAGYASHFEARGIELERALPIAPARAAAGPSPVSVEQRIALDPDGTAVSRRPGTIFDPGGIAKGVFADQLAASLAGFDAFAVDCAGDIRLGGGARVGRPVHLTSPFEGRPLHTFTLAGGGIATSGITKRSWIDADGRAAHHLLDPRTGRAAFTGVVQATALAPTAAQAEVLTKAALLSGPERAAEWLRYGGAFVRDDGSYEVLEPAAAPQPTRAESQLRISASTSSRSGSLRISW